MRPATKAAALVLLVAMVASQTACPEGKKLAPYAEDIVEGLSLSLSLLQQSGVDIVKVQKAIDLGRQLVTALKSEGGGDPVNLVNQIIAHFDQIVAEVNKLPIPQQRRNQILLGLVGVQIALRIISRNIAEKAPEGVQEVNGVKAYAARPNWRCRNAASGRFEKMDVCRKNPTGTVIETY